MQSQVIPLPMSWPATVRSAVLHMLALARFVAIHTRSWAANSANERVRQRGEIDRLRSEALMLREEIRIKASRIERLDPRHRPRFSPIERMCQRALETSHRGRNEKQPF